MISRRHWLTAAAPLVLTARKSGAAPARRPNILFLFTDDQRFDTIAALGHPQVRTPTMDKLVARGTAFTRACIQGGTIGAVCAPSRAMMLTGQYLFRVHDSIVRPKPGAPPFSLYPELMREAGYTTFGTGKWHNGPALFNRCFGGGENVMFGGMSDHLKVPVMSYDRTGKYPREGRRSGEKFSSELFSDSALRFLRTQKGGSVPFLLYVAYTAPHDPRMAPEAFTRLYDPARMTLPPNFLPQHPFDNGEMKVRDEALAPWPRTPEEVRRHIAAYYAMITEVDSEMGRVLRALEDSGRLRDTVIVFSADNGLAVGQHGLLGKQNLYDHSIRVPLVIGGPGVPAGRRNDALCYLLDICPTLLEMSGVPVPKNVDGESLLPAIQGGTRKVRDSVLAAYRHIQRAVRTERHKLIEYNVNGARTTQLFDLEKDRWEMHNLAQEASQRARVEEMRGLLRQWMKRAGDPLDLDKPDWGAKSLAAGVAANPEFLAAPQPSRKFPAIGGTA